MGADDIADLVQEARDNCIDPVQSGWEDEYGSIHDSQDSATLANMIFYVLAGGISKIDSFPVISALLNEYAIEKK